MSKEPDRHYNEERDGLLATGAFRVRRPAGPVVDISRVYLRSYALDWQTPPVDIYLIIDRDIHRVWFLPAGANEMQDAGRDGVEWRWA